MLPGPLSSNQRDPRAEQRDPGPPPTGPCEGRSEEVCVFWTDASKWADENNGKIAAARVYRTPEL